ncbi:hypothetical protein [Aquimarina litoralis]|uniref:hypothetical protein n=1 Tax=Aquimarina litoralis TaxID=584605 RepID=UPI001C59FC70|nr:hypothetical protein [Aquimarina litoralis]MBW1297417.1 hypothetical protein [Aquimarina litoralis]
MPKKSSEIIYKSRLSTFNLIMMIVGCLFLIGMGITMLINTQESGINWVIVFPLVFILLGGLIAYHTLLLCTITITKKHLVLTYPFIGRKKNIEWKSISDAGMEFITTQSSASDYSYKTGKEIRFFSNDKNYRITTFAIKHPDKLMLELNKRIDSNLKRKMKSEYKKTEREFLKEQNQYQRWMMKIVLPICLIILVLLWILKK